MSAISPLIAVAPAAILFLMPILSYSQAVPAAGPVDISSQKVKIVANFEEGVDSPFSIVATNFAPHFWTSASPWYSYTKVSGPANTTNSAWGDEPDNINWWDVVAKNAGSAGTWTEYSDNDYQLFITKGQTYYPTTFDAGFATNYQDWRGYANLQMKLWLSHSEAASGKKVNLQIWAYSAYGSGVWRQIGWMDETGDVIKTVSFSLSPFSSDELSKIAYIKFRVFNNYLTPGSTTSFQRNHLFSIKLQGTTAAVTTEHGSTKWSTRFLGSVSHKRYGSYSADGFYDEYSNTFKIWFGGGAPEGDAMDHVYYLESPGNSLSPGTDFTNAVRCTLNDSNVLVRKNGVIATWGDPAVVKFHGATQDIYYMYFSAQDNPANNKNSIYRAYSHNGKDFVMSPTTPVVNGSPSSGTNVYGSGAPSIVYLTSTSTYYMYYFSDHEAAGIGCYRRTSPDGITWSSPTLVALNQPNMAVKYIDSIGKWVGLTEDGNGSPKLKTSVSNDGIHWRITPDNSVAGDPAMYTCHNPGFIGNSLGLGSVNMYYTFGASEQGISPGEYLSRQLEYGAWTISVGPEFQQDSFETPVLTAGASGYVYTPSGTPWTFTGNAGVSANGSSLTSGNPDAPEFAQVAFVRQTGSIQQTLNLPAGQYALTFKIAQRGNSGLNSQRLRVLVDGVSAGEFTPTSTSYVSEGTSWVTLAAGNHTFTFQGMETTDQTAFIDAIALYHQ